MTTDDEKRTREFEALLDYLKRTRGFDFTAYKRSSPWRRINKRMQTLGLDDYSSYIDYLEVHPDEFSQLFNTILINVTGFFRDSGAWDYMKSEALPRILAAREPNEPIRIWTAGCATGEEAYTLAMILAELMGEGAFRERVKIYATDVDDEELAKARQAAYSGREVQGVPPDLLPKYFEVSVAGFSFRKDLRRNVIFGRHDLIHDAPISRVDLLTCRNVLMYFNAETQAKILARFHFALNDVGYLFLGRAEMILTHTHIFQPVELKHRVFARVLGASLKDRLTIPSASDAPDAVHQLTYHIRIRDAAFDASQMAQIVVDHNGYMVLANERARAMFHMTPNDVGRLIQDLQLSYRPVELRSLIEQVHSDRRPISLKDIRWTVPPEESRYLDVTVTPLLDSSGGLLGVNATFTDVTRYKRLQEDVEKANQELETAYEELQSTVEELETTNEELQSTIEELETTNEELQSTNEELETMNEELQSTNEELETINDEVRCRSEELNEVNAFLGSILASLRGGVIVLDKDLRVIVWNDKAEDLWGLRSAEARGQHFLNLDSGLPVQSIRPLIRSCLSGDSEHEEERIEATNRKGKTITCRVACTPLRGANQELRGTILLMEDVTEPVSPTSPSPDGDSSG